ncbi:MAG: response regulator receiver protein [Phenylobacterium sp.]|nr:response regulator receiver protein [Phenylobacterium sp.]MDB5495284.1 response regulator receiver protein [Phenylobacterium sp.]
MAKNNPISIVDDDESVREAMAGLMKSHGYHVETFDSGPSFLSSDHRSRTDCLIADVQMPGMTGLELHCQLIADGHPIPTILITAHPDDRVRARAMKAGVLCYLAKPFSEDDLLGCIRTAIERRGAGREPT